MRIAMTGSTGLVGSFLLPRLSETHQVTELVRSPTRVQQQPLDLSDVPQLVSALRGHDLVLHLAAETSQNDTDLLFSTNVVGFRNLLTAAVSAGVGRVVYPSTVGIFQGNYDRMQEFVAQNPRPSKELKHEFINSLLPMCRDDFYCETKLFGEVLCRRFSKERGLGCTIVRIGEVNAADRPEIGHPLTPIRWCSQSDLTAFFLEAISVTQPGQVKVLTAVSDAP